MTYSNKLVAVIKVNGKVLREMGDTVTIPFGSEYSVLLKNLNSVRVQVKVSIDGIDATEGTWLVIQPNSSIELERFIKNGNLSAGNRFKFIERTSEIEDHRGIKEDDGIVRIEYKTEQITKTEDIHVTKYHYDYVYPCFPWKYYHYGPYWTTTTTSSGNIQNGQNVQQSTGGSCLRGLSGSVNFAGMSSGAGILGEPVNDAGITVPGSESNQQFYKTSNFATHNYTDVLVLRLRGKVADKKVIEPITVYEKMTCPTCGTISKCKSSVKYCSRCGTCLIKFY